MRATLFKIYISAIPLCLKEETSGDNYGEQPQALHWVGVAFQTLRAVQTVAQMRPVEVPMFTALSVDFPLKAMGSLWKSLRVSESR